MASLLPAGGALFSFDSMLDKQERALSEEILETGFINLSTLSETARESESEPN